MLNKYSVPSTQKLDIFFWIFYVTIWFIMLVFPELSLARTCTYYNPNLQYGILNVQHDLSSVKLAAVV